MTVIPLVRVVAITLVGLVGVHIAVWGMDVMAAEMGESSTLNRTTWWTAEGWRTSAMVQLRVGTIAIVLGACLRAFVVGVSPRAKLFFFFGLFTISMIGAVIVEAVWLSAVGLGPTRAEVNALLGPFAHNGLAIGAAVAASHWIRYSTERRFTVAHDAGVRSR